MTSPAESLKPPEFDDPTAFDIVQDTFENRIGQVMEALRAAEPGSEIANTYSTRIDKLIAARNNLPADNRKAVDVAQLLLDAIDFSVASPSPEVSGDRTSDAA